MNLLKSLPLLSAEILENSHAAKYNPFYLQIRMHLRKTGSLTPFIDQLAHPNA